MSADVAADVARDVDADGHAPARDADAIVDGDMDVAAVEADVLRREIATSHDAALHFRVVRMMARVGFGYEFQV